MLVLSRRLNESILIGDDIEVVVTQVKGTGDQAVVRLGIRAPRDVVVLRREVYDEIVAATRQAAQAPAAEGLARLLQGEQAGPVRPDKE